MRSLFYKLYFLLTGPLYRRLHRELSLQKQEVVRANVEHHENTSKKILDELLRLSYVVNGGTDTNAATEMTKTMTDTEIAAIIKEVDSSLGLVEVCRKHELPLNTAFLLRSKFRGMSEPGIRRTRELEDQYAELSQKVETLLLENKRLSASTPPVAMTSAITSGLVVSESKACQFSSTTPKVTIITPSYNQGNFIERTILSVLQQDYPNLQYIVLDSLSKDNTHKILERYRSEISIVIEAKDKGQADAINKGFAAGDGEILAYLNSDDCYSAPDTVSRAVKHLVQNPHVDVVYGKRYYIDVNGYFYLSYPYRAFDEKQLVQACYLPQECCFWTKSIYEKAGSKVNEDYQFAMDYELWLRFLKYGAKFESVDEVYGYFRWYPGQKSTEEWQSTGLPEIAKLQKEYFGTNTSAEVMSDIFMEHYSTVNKSTDVDRFSLYEKLWFEEVKLKQSLFRYAPLDHWVFQRPNSKDSVANERRVS